MKGGTSNNAANKAGAITVITPAHYTDLQEVQKFLQKLSNNARSPVLFLLRVTRKLESHSEKNFCTARADATSYRDLLY